MEYNFTETAVKEGLILPFDKPYEWTSFDLVNKVRRDLCRHVGIKKLKVGHAGTLDPLATGLLILCTGKATKQINSIQSLYKEYEAEITLGATTPSFDLETEVNETFPTGHITRELLQKTLEDQFRGTIEQVPPIFSAKKINGVRAYEMAREGIEKELKSVPVEIFNMEILHFELPVVRLRIACSKGTYIRSLARDLGLALDSGGYLSALRRTAIGDYSIGQSVTLENFKNLLK